MAIYAISDLHLSFSNKEKSMELFGDDWKDYQERIEKNWTETVKIGDTVIIPRRYILGIKFGRSFCRFFFFK